MFSFASWQYASILNDIRESKQEMYNFCVMNFRKPSFSLCPELEKNECAAWICFLSVFSVMSCPWASDCLRLVTQGEVMPDDLISGLEINRRAWIIPSYRSIRNGCMFLWKQWTIHVQIVVDFEFHVRETELLRVMMSLIERRLLFFLSFPAANFLGQPIFRLVNSARKEREKITEK